MSPTVFREGPYRFYFLSNEETREHIHVESEKGKAKFWVKPSIELALSRGYNNHELNEIERLIVAHKKEILDAWEEHFSR